MYDHQHHQHHHHHQVRREDGGSYLVQADNKIGEKRKEVLLVVNYRPSLGSLSEEVNHISIISIIFQSYQPYINHTNQDIKI